MFLKCIESERLNEKKNGEWLVSNLFSPFFLSVFQADMNKARIDEANQRANKLIQ